MPRDPGAPHAARDCTRLERALGQRRKARPNVRGVRDRAGWREPASHVCSRGRSEVWLRGPQAQPLISESARRHRDECQPRGSPSRPGAVSTRGRLGNRSIFSAMPDTDGTLYFASSSTLLRTSITGELPRSRSAALQTSPTSRSALTPAPLAAPVRMPPPSAPMAMSTMRGRASGSSTLIAADLVRAPRGARGSRGCASSKESEAFL